MDLTNEFKQKILCSKQLLDKCKIFQQYEKRFLDKGYDDFSDHVTDSIELELHIENGKYSVYCSESNEYENMEQYTYFNIIKEVLEKLVSDLKIREYLSSIGLNVKYELLCHFEFDIKYRFDKNRFILKSIKSCKILKFLKDEKNCFEITAAEPDSQYQKSNFIGRKIILGYADSEEKAKIINHQLIDDKKYLNLLNELIKTELFEIIQIIRDPDKINYISLYAEEKDTIDSKLNSLFKEHNDAIENKVYLTKLNELLNSNFSEYKEILSLNIKTIIDTWLNKNCKKELRNLVDYYKYNYYFSLTENWLEFIWFMDENIVIDFRKV